MPPGPDHAPLSSEEASLLERWIEQGAPYDQHWAYRPLERPAVPEVGDDGWARGDLDRFVLARLEAEGITPAPLADARTRTRRLSFDLLGLAPSIEQVRAVELDPDDFVWAQLVDELLESPHHAERLTTFWFDLVRLITWAVGAWTPSSTLFFLGLLFLLVVSLNYAVRLSGLRREMSTLAQELALLRVDRHPDDPAAGDPPQPRS